MTSEPVELVVDALERVGSKVKRCGNGAQAQCPAHDDAAPSLSVSPNGDGRALVHCHAGCTVDEVVAALGLTLADLFPANGATATRVTVVAQYRYVDENGAVLYEVVREHPKAFKHRRPDGHGGWIYKGAMAGVRHVLYNLPAVRAAVADARPVWVVEGEKDADTLNRLGQVATTNSGGAGNWHTVTDAADILKGAAVVSIAADKDDAGRNRARQIWQTLDGRVDHLLIVEAAAGNDITDHFTAGLDFDDLVIRADSINAADGQNEYLDDSPTAPDDEPDDGGSWEPVDLGPAWRGEKVRPEATVLQRDDGVALLLPGLNYLFGTSGDGKSLVALLAVVQEIRAGRHAVWITYEDADELTVVERLRQLGVTFEEISRLYFIAPRNELSAGIDRTAALIDSVGARLAVLDSVGDAMSVGGINEDRDYEVGPWFLTTVRRLCTLVPSLALWPIDHSTKAADNPLFPSGSKRKRAVVSGRGFLLNVRQPFAKGEVGFVQLVVSKDRGGTFRRGAIAAEIRLDATRNPYEFAITAPRDGDTYAPKTKRRTAVDRVLEVLEDSSTALTPGEVLRIVNDPTHRKDEASLGLGAVKNALTRLADQPEVVKTNTGSHSPARWHIQRHNDDASESTDG